MTAFDRTFLRALDIQVPEFGVTDKMLLEIMPAQEWRAVERAAQMMNEGFTPRAEGHRRAAGYGGLSEPPRTPED